MLESPDGISISMTKTTKTDGDKIDKTLLNEFLGITAEDLIGRVCT